ncbi:hypothetical protein AVEN_155416-1 [Araneus ventricosus]|uniref:Uncharacterized protein n=1 Tax=Araneus ventricosus TaxID=182803 RepID=A0A4Y2MMK9_ARAVE|nr:hypothetical protein AVEN_155416-1 [Araneus ventricosus]
MPGSVQLQGGTWWPNGKATALGPEGSRLETRFHPNSTVLGLLHASVQTPSRWCASRKLVEGKGVQARARTDASVTAKAAAVRRHMTPCSLMALFTLARQSFVSGSRRVRILVCQWDRSGFDGKSSQCYRNKLQCSDVKSFASGIRPRWMAVSEAESVLEGK